jgi:glycosyltransferase involved in cell wall biosynthesis
MLASIVIRTHNESRYLPELLLSIREQSIPSDQYEVVIVDSGSTDATLDIAKRHGCRIQHIRQSEFSFGRSLNVGCDAALGRFLIFISGHCVPVGHKWLENLLVPLESKEAHITYGRQEGGVETRFSEHMLFAKYFPAADVPPPNEFFCNNANSAIVRDIWAKYRFDETLTGLEDMHIARQVVADGGKVRYVPSASVYHFHHESWSRVKRRYEREAIALQKIMPEVHVHASDAIRYFIAAVLGDWAKAISQNQFLKRGWEISCFRFCQYYGTWRGNHMHRNLSRRAKERYFYPH